MSKLWLHVCPHTSFHLSPRIVSNRLFPGSSLDVDILLSGEWKQGQKFQQFSHEDIPQDWRIVSDLFYTAVVAASAITFTLSPEGGRNPLFTKKAKFREDHPSSTVMVYVRPGYNFKDLHSDDCLSSLFLGTSIFEVCWSPEYFLFILPVKTAGIV